jgi:hypothetical protein
MNRSGALAVSMKLRWAALPLLAVGGCIIQSPDELIADRPPITAVNVSPVNAVVEAGGSVQFLSTVIGEGTVPLGVTWTVRPGSSSGPAGTVDNQGLYRVDKPVKADTRDYVVATSMADPAISAVAAVDVPEWGSRRRGEPTGPHPAFMDIPSLTSLNLATICAIKPPALDQGDSRKL